MKEALAVVLGLLIILAIGWLGVANDVAIRAWVAPKNAQIDHDVYVQSDANRRGMAAQIEKERIEYMHATGNDKLSMRTIILDQCAGYDINLLPDYDRAFIQQLRDQQ
jgi:hypothetical protein